MKSMREYLVCFMEKLDFPEEAKKKFLDVNALFEQDEHYSSEMDTIIRDFFYDNENHPIVEILKRLDHLGQRMSIHSYTIHFIFYIYCSDLLHERYEKRGVSEDIYWNSMLDLRCKLFECHNIYNIWGTFVGKWFPGFYTMNRFALGRLQYEDIRFSFDKYTKGDYTAYKGDKVYNIHIPSSGPLNREKRIDSYQKAYEFYKRELNGRPLVLVCNSWLLYPKNEMFLSKDSNIIDFMHDFEIISSKEHDNFSDAWRIFGKEYDKPLEQLPVRTSLQRSFANWLKAGNKTGSGYGIMFFDGKNIL